MTLHKDDLIAYIGNLTPIQLSWLEKEKKEGNYQEAQWDEDDYHNMFEIKRARYKSCCNLEEEWKTRELYASLTTYRIL
ncbi:hypothetical protein AHAS_Ahas02G0035200 [Arachis hypogaea]